MAARTGMLVSLAVLAACAPRQKAPVAPVAVTQVHLAVYARGEDLPLWEIELPLLNRSQSR